VFHNSALIEQEVHRDASQINSDVALNISEVQWVVRESRCSTLAGELAAPNEFVAARGVAAAFKFLAA
jgi:hypothetical protein